MSAEIRYILAANRGLRTCYSKWLGQPKYTLREWSEAGGQTVRESAFPS